MSQEKLTSQTCQTMIYRVQLIVLKSEKGELFVARTLAPNANELKTDKAFLNFLEETFAQLLKFYK